MNGMGLCCCGCLGIMPSVDAAPVVPYWTSSVRIKLRAVGAFRTCSFVSAAPSNTSIELLCDYDRDDTDYWYFVRPTNHGRTLFAEVRLSKAYQSGQPYGTFYHKDIRVEIRDPSALDGLLVQTVDPEETTSEIQPNENWETLPISGYRGVGCVAYAEHLHHVFSVRRFWEPDIPATRTCTWAPGGLVTLPFMYGQSTDGFYIQARWGTTIAGTSYNLWVGGVNLRGGEVSTDADFENGKYQTITLPATAARDKEAEVTDLSLFTAVSSPPSLTGITC
jgi:hypothetical protein